WAQRADRRKRRDKYRLAFVPSKFRIGEEPDPFCLELDLSSEPWQLRDVTAEIVHAGQEAVAESNRQRQNLEEHGIARLLEAIRDQAGGDNPVLADRDAVRMLRDEGLKQAHARRVIDAGEGIHWRSERLQRRGKPKGLYPLSALTQSINTTLNGNEGDPES